MEFAKPTFQKVLIVDDSKLIHTLVRARLKDEPIELFSAMDGTEGLVMMAQVQPDLVLLDVNMPPPDGFDVCRRMKAHAVWQNIPVIFLTGATSTEEKIRGLDLGAVDYVTKPFDGAELCARVRATLRTKFLVDLLAQKAMIDGLTGLWNRAYLEQRLAAEMALALRTRGTVGCIMVDADCFKKLNDEHGHPFGDTVLRTIAQTLTAGCRQQDVVCRYGGEEFVVLTPGVDAMGAAALAERLREQVAGVRLTRNGQPVQITCSFGVADNGGGAGESVIQQADRALYRAKEGGRNRVEAACGRAGLRLAGVAS